MEKYPQELAQDAVCQNHTGHMNGLCFLPARPLRLNTNECNSIIFVTPVYLYIYILTNITHLTINPPTWKIW